MQRILLAILALLLSMATSQGGAQDREFCRGFSEGWKTLKGEMALVPLCPLAPLTPLGSTPYREGLKAGMAAAKRQGGGNMGGAAPRDDRRDEREDFCDGFQEGWKTVKGEMSVVPICPIAPITPLGSTPYREGLKAGMQRGRAS